MRNEFFESQMPAALTSRSWRLPTLDVAIDRIVWELLGLNADGRIVEEKAPCR